MTYSNTLASGRGQYMRRNQNVTTFKSKDKAIGPVSNTIILIVLACLLGLLYLTQVTKTNTFGYQLNELNKQQTSLQQEHDELEVASARLQSLERVKTSEQANQLVSVAPSATIQE
ncbi:MAG: hypothetical protein H6793_00380 [Candidatus Nomurabacteria bacterium]|nr:hypothetical protein [Candidatus Saccharibacteria bacterium]USN95613.1 MAG: hypothetical protein H6793_00380 [Candidatus Nomurabacteria bacterium]